MKLHSLKSIIYILFLVMSVGKTFAMEKDQEPLTSSMRTGTKYILSLDGGGVGGIIPLTFLSKVRESLGKDLQGRPFQFYQAFDLIVGNSIGGITALSLSCAEDDTFPEEHLLALLKSGESIFERANANSSDVASTTTSMLDRTYQLEKRLQGYFHPKKMEDAKTRVLVTAVQKGDDSHTFIFNNEGPYQAVPMWQVARATSAADGSFPPMRVDGIEEELEDAGRIYNNPAQVGYKALRGYEPHAHIVLISFGTGKIIDEENVIESIKDEKKREVRKKIATTMQAVHDALEKESNLKENNLTYIRIQPDILSEHGEAFKFTEENISALVGYGECMFKEHGEKVKNHIKQSLEEKKSLLSQGEKK